MPWARSIVQRFGTSQTRPGSAASGEATSPPGMATPGPGSLPPGAGSLPPGAPGPPLPAAEGAGVIWMLMFQAMNANAIMAATAMPMMARMDMWDVLPGQSSRAYGPHIGALPDG